MDDSSIMRRTCLVIRPLRLPLYVCISKYRVHVRQRPSSLILVRVILRCLQDQTASQVGRCHAILLYTTYFQAPGASLVSVLVLQAPFPPSSACWIGCRSLYVLQVWQSPRDTALPLYKIGIPSQSCTTGPKSAKGSWFLPLGAPENIN